MIYHLIYLSPLGPIAIEETDNKISAVSFLTPVGGTLKETPLLKEAARQLDEYFAGTRRTFNLPLHIQGTPFQQKVWQALLTIPYGETRSYKQIAEQADCPKGCRAVGMANNKNKIGIVIPCHRVIGSDGTLTGYAGGLNIKQALLELEQSRKKD